MKIVCVMRSLNMGGAQRQITRLAVELKQAGHEVVMLPYRGGTFFLPLLEANGVQVDTLPHRSGLIHLLTDMRDYLKAMQPDVVISYLIGPNTKLCAVHRLYPHFHLVVSERSAYTHVTPSVFLRYLLYREAEAIVPNSYAQEQFIRRHYPRLVSRTTTITNFFDQEAFRPLENPVHHTGQRLIVTTARVARQKNVLRYIRAVAELQRRGLDFHVEWYGVASHGLYYRLCQRAIRRQRLEGMFVLREKVANVVEVYHSADIFCLPSLYEGTSNALGEALSCGLPVACSRVSDNPIYVAEGRNGVLFNPRKVSSIVDGLEQMLRLTDDELTAYGRQSRATAEAHFDKRVFVQKYEQLLSQFKA